MFVVYDISRRPTSAIIEFRCYNFLYAVLPDPFPSPYSNRGLACETSVERGARDDIRTRVTHMHAARVIFLHFYLI